MSHDLGPLPRIHPRVNVVKVAERALADALCEWARSHRHLTLPERISVMAGVLNEEIQSEMRHLIRMERHGDPEKPGGLE